MSLTALLQNCARSFPDGTRALHPTTLEFAAGSVTALLGPSGCGKTTTLRLLAGLAMPDAGGRVLFDGTDVTGLPVEQRGIGMVFQNYALFPNRDVAGNIGYGLEVRGVPKAERTARVAEMLRLTRLEGLGHRRVDQLSGGQRQRVALARALAKAAPLMLLDEPLVNLDYKLREELRDELTALFAAGDSTVIYATTEPGEALLLGGYTAVLDAGELLQYGPTSEVFHAPCSIRVARAFSDPPMNLLGARRTASGVQLDHGPLLDMALPSAAQSTGALTVGMRASALRTVAQPGDVALPGKVELAEISGTDTFVHFQTAIGELVAQLTGVHHFDLGAPATFYFSPAQVYAFDAQGLLLQAPVRGKGR